MRQCVSQGENMKQATVKTLMKKGLINLLAKRKFVEITVTDLIRESKIARASFYRVYNNIDQVLEEVVADVRTKFEVNFLPTIIKKDEKELKKKTAAFFRSVQNDETFLFTLLPENTSIIVSKVEQMGVFNEIEPKDDSIEARFLPGLVFVNIAAIIKIWKRRGCVETPEEMADFTYRTIGKKYLML